MNELEGRVAIVTGAGRGIGREHALLFAAEGAKVVVNDLGGNTDGTGADASPAQQVVDEITAAGGTAIANFDDVADWDGAKRMIDQAVATFGDLHILVNNAGILRDRMLVNMSAEEWDAVIRVHLRGHFCPTRWAAAYWREQSKAGHDGQTVGDQHLVDVRPLRQSRADQLRRRQDRHRHLLDDRRLRTGPLRRAGQRHRAGRRHPPDQRPHSRRAQNQPTDEWSPIAPANIAPFVAYLATEDCPIHGRIFLVVRGHGPPVPALRHHRRHREGRPLDRRTSSGPRRRASPTCPSPQQPVRGSDGLTGPGLVTRTRSQSDAARTSSTDSPLAWAASSILW